MTRGDALAPLGAPSGLPDARLRLAYINQHRELALGALLGLTAAARLFGVPISGAALLAVALWFALAWAFVRVSRRALAEARLHQIEFAYFVLELGLITLLAQYAGAAAWLALLFYVVTILYANMVLPRRAALGIAALAAAGLSALVALDAVVSLRSPTPLPRIGLFAGPDFNHPAYLAATLVAGALGGYALIGLTLSQFSHMLNRQAAALQAANRDLSVASLELRLHRDHLEELVRQRTSDLLRASDELRHANRELRRLNQLKNNFLANVSHELRTPLTSIRSFSEILLHYPDEDASTRGEFLEIIMSESDRLTRLINDVLDLAKIEAGKMEWRPQPVQLAELVRQSLDVIQVVAARKGLRLENLVRADLPLVRADPDRMRQVLTNLLSNALKFTAAGVIQVGALAPPGQASEVVLFVADTGRGIPPADLERIFEKFHQHGNVLTDKPAGTGLGLSICREIMRHHGGRIWAESQERQGSTFYCALPAIEAPARQGSASAANG